MRHPSASSPKWYPGFPVVIPALAVSVFVLAVGAAGAEENAAGGWHAGRAALAARGVTLELASAFDGMRVVHGGLDRRAVSLATLDAALVVEGGALAGWSGWSATVRGIGHRGESPSAYVGDAQAVDNLDFPTGWRLSEAWIEGARAGLAVRAGVYNLNSEFDAGTVGGLFLHSSHGMGADFAQSGLNGPSSDPNTGLAARVSWQPIPSLVVRAAVADGLPGDPSHPTRTDLRWREGDGVLIAAEVDWMRCAPGDADPPCGRLAIGGWRYSGEFTHVADVEGTGQYPPRAGSRGAYALLERQLTRESADRAQGLAGWTRAGLAEADVYAFSSFIGAGFVYIGALPRRGEDALGIAVAAANASRDYQDGRAACGLGTRAHEVAFELTYRAQLAPWLALQPDVQYVNHPGLEPCVSDAVVLGARLEASF